jgi:hypothetical protein
VPRVAGRGLIAQEKHEVRMLLFLGAAAALAQDAGLIQLVDPLDQPDGDRYCADVVGTDVEARLTIQAHTCKGRGTEDQIFATDAPRTGKISLPDSGLCLMAQRVAAGSSIITAECGRDSRQRWVSGADGQIHPVEDRSLCWTVRDGRGEPAGGGYLKRVLTLEPCADFGVRYNTWILPDPIGRGR